MIRIKFIMYLVCRSCSKIYEYFFCKRCKKRHNPQILHFCAIGSFPKKGPGPYGQPSGQAGRRSAAQETRQEAESIAAAATEPTPSLQQLQVDSQPHRIFRYGQWSWFILKLPERKGILDCKLNWYLKSSKHVIFLVGFKTLSTYIKSWLVGWSP